MNYYKIHGFMNLDSRLCQSLDPDNIKLKNLYS